MMMSWVRRAHRDLPENMDEWRVKPLIEAEAAEDGVVRIKGGYGCRRAKRTPEGAFLEGDAGKARFAHQDDIDWCVGHGLQVPGEWSGTYLNTEAGREALERYMAWKQAA